MVEMVEVVAQLLLVRMDIRCILWVEEAAMVQQVVAEVMAAVVHPIIMDLAVKVDKEGLAAMGGIPLPIAAVVVIILGMVAGEAMLVGKIQ